VSALQVLDPVAGATSELDPADFLLERYAHRPARTPARDVYYRVKPLVPRSAQLALRRAYARRQRAHPFPHWPIEPLLVDHLERRIRAALAAREDRELPFVWFWPHGHAHAVVLTHDVEGPAGLANIDRVLEIERRYGLASWWTFCAEWYPIPDGTFDRLRDAGCEVGLHGITHDNRLFRNRASFEAQLPKVHHYLREWGAEGFRSPSTYRNAAWMPELGARFDSSFPDTDPFQPTAGGCCAIFPYFLRDMVELPITLPQDQVLWEILGERTTDLWTAKAAWVSEHHGLTTLLVHPDYVGRADRLALYERFVAHLASLHGAWHALPGEVASWWRARRDLGADAPHAVGARAREERGRIVFEIGENRPGRPPGGDGTVTT
jgi:peptidoglycan/xylan/chitin deacetylase (PgdA/CDA1 family)